MSENGFLSRKAFFEADAFKTQVVELPEMGEGARAFVRELNAFEIEEVGYGGVNQDGKTDVRATKGMRAQIVLWATIDEEGNPIFNRGDAQRLPKLPSGIITKLATAILKLSGLGETLTTQYICPECGKEFAVAADLAKTAELRPICPKCGVAFVEKTQEGEAPNG